LTDLVHDSKIIDWTDSANWTEKLSSGASAKDSWFDWWKNYR